MLTVYKKESRFDEKYNLSWLSSLSKVFIFRKQQSTQHCSVQIAETLKSAVDKRGHLVTFTRHILDKGSMGISIFLREKYSGNWRFSRLFVVAFFRFIIIWNSQGEHDCVVRQRIDRFLLQYDVWLLHYMIVLVLCYKFIKIFQKIIPKRMNRVCSLNLNMIPKCKLPNLGRDEWNWPEI